MTAPSAELLEQAVAQRGAGVWFWLFAIELRTDADASLWLLLTSHSQVVTFDGEDYAPWRVRFAKLESGAAGNLAGETIAFSNVGGVAAEYLRQFEGLRGRRLFVRLVNSLHLDAATHAVPHVYRIANSEVGTESASLTVGHLPLHEMACPSRRFARRVCGVAFRGTLCGWETSQGGDEDACDRGYGTPNGCVAHSNAPRFGGQTAMPGTR